MFLEIQATTTKKVADDTVGIPQDNSAGTCDCACTSFGNSRKIDSISSELEKWKKLRTNTELPLGLTTTTTNMAELDKYMERAQKSLREMPYAVTEKIMKSMDIDKSWEKLAGAAGYNMTEILQIKSEQYKHDGSPTRRLLWQLGCQSYKVHDLFEKLNECNRKYEMNVLKDYVLKGGQEPKYTSFSCSSSQAGSHSLESLISQLDLSGPQSQPKMSVSSGYNSSGSEVNFDRHPKVGMSPSKKGDSKIYDDKVIPGTEQSNKYSSASVSKFFQEGASLSQVLRRHAESTAVQNNRCQGPFGSSGSEFTLPSSFSISSSGNRSSEAAQRLMNQLTSTEKPQKTTSHEPVENQSMDDIAIGMKAAFTHREISQATQNFCDQNYVGHGAFGTVYYGCLRGQECAIKLLNEAPIHHTERWDQLKKELKPLLMYQHKNIVTLYGYVLEGPKVCLVYEYLKNGSLDDRLRQKNNTLSLPWERRLNILVGACQGLNFLHTMGSKPLIHGDIKSANILLDKYLEAKICDLGQAAYATSGTLDKSSPTHITIAESSSKLFGTKAYQAPEILSKSSISIKSDIYSMGVVFLEVCSGLPAYDQNRNENKFLVSLFKNQIKERDESERVAEFGDKSADPPDPNIFIKLLKLADRCTCEVQSRRPKSDELLERMEQLYNQYPEALIDNEGTCNSISTSVRANSDISTHSNYQSISDRVSSVGMSSGVGLSGSGHSVVLQGGAPSPSLSIQLQNTKMKAYSFPAPYCDQTYLVSQPEAGFQVPSPSSQSLENYEQSEPHRLQELYDKYPGKRIDKLPISVETCNRDTTPQDNLTNPNFSDQISPEDYFPPADPHKMEMLMQFDAQNITPSSEDTVFKVHECSQEKLRYLTELSDQVSYSTSQPKAEPTATNVGYLVGETNSGTLYQNRQSFMQNISSHNTCHDAENVSAMKRSSDIDNNAIEAVKKGEVFQSEICDKGHQADSIQNEEAMYEESMKKRRQLLFSSYCDEVNRQEGSFEDDEGI